MNRGIFTRTALVAAALLACGVAHTDEPGAVLGAGIQKCRVLVNMASDERTKPVATLIFAWVQGWFSARNIAPPNDHAPLTVGGSLSPETLQGYLVTMCKKFPETPVFVAANGIYEVLKEEGK